LNNVDFPALGNPTMPTLSMRAGSILGSGHVPL
jgi:hypothetical protein